MPEIYVKNGGSFSAVKQPFIKNGGIWSAPTSEYVKSGGVWSKASPPTGTQTINTIGSGAFTVPDGITKLTVSYPTQYGLVTTTLNVTGGQVLPYTVGSYGAPSTFSTITAPKMDYVAGTFSGNVDANLYSVYGLVASGNTPRAYAGSGDSATLTPAVAACGLVYEEFYENSHGDLGADLYIYGMPTSCAIGPMQVYLTNASGRGSISINTQPYSPTYRATIYINDPSSSEGGYSYTLNVQQAVGFILSW